jgi:hypothetical protein
MDALLKLFAQFSVAGGARVVGRNAKRTWGTTAGMDADRELTGS